VTLDLNEEDLRRRFYIHLLAVKTLVSVRFSDRCVYQFHQSPIVM